MNLQKKIALAVIGLLSGCSQSPVHKDQGLPAALEELPTPVIEKIIDQKELTCLTENIYYEARNQGVVGMTVIANVTMNRVAAKRWKGTVCGVVKQKRVIGKRTVCQFSWYCESFHKPPQADADVKAWEISKQLASAALSGDLNDLTNGATHYHTVSVKPVWRKNLKYISTIGSHIFYKEA
jgi:spore germination cell wall hydrolase CwlJ-like protein